MHACACARGQCKRTMRTYYWKCETELLWLSCQMDVRQVKHVSWFQVVSEIVCLVWSEGWDGGGSFQNEENLGAAHKSTISERLQEKKKEKEPHSRSAFSMAYTRFTLHHNHNGDTSSFIKKTRMTSCELSNCPWHVHRVSRVAKLSG